VFDVIDARPGKLRDVDGIGPARAAQIVEAWSGQKVIRDIMVFLYAHGVGTSRAVRIYKTYGADAIARITENPYRLARDIRGIGFVTADALARTLGIEPTAPIRARAGVAHALMQALDEGQCGLPRDELVALAETLLAVPTDVVTAALQAELDDGTVVADTSGGRDCIFLAWLHTMERQIAETLRALAAGRPHGRRSTRRRPSSGWSGNSASPWPSASATPCDSPLPQGDGHHRWAGRREDHHRARHPAILGAKRVRVALCAPTGERPSASRRVRPRGEDDSPAAGGEPGRRPVPARPASPIECDLLVVDETSMVDVPLMHALVRAVPPRAALILVGDVDQLPSVGPGRVLADIIDAGPVPVVRLTEVFRQAAESRIIVNAHRVNHGQMPELTVGPDTPSDFYFVEIDTPEEGLPKIIQIVSERIPQRFGLHPVRDVQVLCPMNRGAVGADR